MIWQRCSAVQSFPASRSVTKLDEAALYVTTGVGLAAAALAAGAGSGSARVGLVGAALAAAGVLVTWRTRRWGLARRLLIGLPIGAAAAASLQGLISWEIQAEASNLYRAPGDVGLTLALRMSVLTIALSFLLITRDMLPFSLVPGLTIFGLVGGRGSLVVVAACFGVFLPAALAALAQAMLLSGMPADGGAGRPRWQVSRWRRRHWMTLGILIATIMALAYLLFVPIAAYATQYRWWLPLNLGGGGFGRLASRRSGRAAFRSYPVGRGPVAPTDTPVLSFEGRPAEFWRGEAFDVYTGNAWVSSGETGARVAATRGIFDLTKILHSDPGAPVVSHVVRAEADVPLVLYGPGQIQRVTLPGVIARGLPEGMRVDKYGCVTAPGALLPAGTRYQVVSVPLTMGIHPQQPFRPGTASPPGELEDTYLTIPLSARRVADLARRVAGSANSPVDKLAALIAFLQQNYVYTLDAPATPMGEDAADHFLFRQRRGYCDLFATALAVMARAVGIPTRVTIGYAGGQYDPQRHRYILRESDAHAWVEAYVPPWGWLSVDAAPAGGAPPLSPLRRTFLSVRFLYQDHPIACAGLASVVLAALCFAVLLAWRARLGPGLHGRGKADPRAIVLRAYARLCHLLARRGTPRHPSQTPLEFLAALESAAAGSLPERSLPLPAESLAPIRALTEIFIPARYGPGPVTEETASLALQRLVEVRTSIRRKLRSPSRPPKTAASA